MTDTQVVASVCFTPNLRRHVGCTTCEAAGETVREVLEAAFALHAPVRDYVLDERGALRKHMAVFVDGQAVTDREGLTDAVSRSSEVYVAQALSGG